MTVAEADVSMDDKGWKKEERHTEGEIEMRMARCRGEREKRDRSNLNLELRVVSYQWPSSIEVGTMSFSHQTRSPLLRSGWIEQRMTLTTHRSTEPTQTVPHQFAVLRLSDHPDSVDHNRPTACGWDDRHGGLHHLGRCHPTTEDIAVPERCASS
jgi:hypothetical protein